MDFRTDLARHFYKHRYLYLLTITLMQVFLVSFFPDRGNLLINEITFSLFMLANLNFVRDNRKFVIVLLVFAVTSVIMVWIPTQSETGQQIFAFEHVITILFISTIIYLIILQVVRSKDVSLNMILGVITIYILFGMVAGSCNQLIYHFNHEAFTGNLDPTDNADLKYFSYVTMTTLGYGDISPVSQLARATAVFFSLLGQIYLAVVIALIVGKYVSHSDREKSKME
jgi:voltage-gated potassium channel